MKSLKFKQTEITVQRTGLPFYDAARVIGVAQLFFGASSALIKETGIGWRLRGIADTSDTQSVVRRLWITERANSLRYGKRRALVHERAQDWQKTDLTKKWEAIKQYFLTGSRDLTIPTEAVYYEIDAALQKGVRGFDSNSYASFASGSGESAKEPEPEVLAAIIGFSHAARVTGDNGFIYLLPVFGELLEQPDEWLPITTAHYWNYDERFSHDAGEQVAETLAVLSILEALCSARLPVMDFAFNSKIGPTYQSGTLGADKLCLLWRAGCDGVLREISSYLRHTSYRKKFGGKPHVFELARTLHDFVRRPAVDSLERIVRLKARAVAENDDYAHSLLDNLEHIRQIIQILKMNEETMNNSYKYKPSPNLCCMVAHALATPKEDSPKTVPPDGWIGRYLKLENASNAKRFVEEIERLLSRATMGANAHENMLEALREDPSSDGTPLTDIRENLRSSQEFRAFRAEFLLMVLHIIARDRDTLVKRALSKRLAQR